jgi:hypothetical protein
MDEGPKHWDFPLDEDEVEELHRRIRRAGQIRQVFEAPPKVAAEVQAQVEKYRAREQEEGCKWELSEARREGIRRERSETECRKGIRKGFIGCVLLFVVPILLFLLLIWLKGL